MARLALGKQLDLFVEADDFDVEGQAYSEGEEASRDNKAAQPVYQPGTPGFDAYMRGFHDHQEELAKGIKKKADDAGSGVAMTRSQFKAQQAAAKKAQEYVEAAEERGALFTKRTSDDAAGSSALIPASGAAAALCPAREGTPPYIYEAIDLPTRSDGMRRRRSVAVGELDIRYQALSHYHRSVGPIPSDGRVAAFRFGEAVGTIHTICRMMKIEPELVSPLVWKGYYLLIQADKEASRRKALRLFRQPTDAGSQEDHNRAEAMLIARWAARPLIGRDW